jgi:hypothetical protein
MTDVTQTTSDTSVANPKFTAEQIEGACPPRLQQIAREITELHKTAQRQVELANDHLIAIEKLLAEAKELCDGGGFYKFRELFCPQLGKSQAYALRAIAAGKKTLAEHRAAERERKQKSRANQRAATANSGTVPEKSTPLEAFTDGGAAEATCTASTPKKRMSLAHFQALAGFSRAARILVQLTSNKKARRFAETSLTADELERLGKLLIDIANIKKSRTINPASIMALPNGAISVWQPAVEAEQAAHQASVDMVA